MKPTEDADFELMWKFHWARGADREALHWPAWLAMWRRIARDYVLDVIFWAATGESHRNNGPFPEVTEAFREECREFLRGAGLHIEHGATGAEESA